MIKKIIFCAFLLFCQNFLLFGQLRVTFKTSKIPPPKDLSVHLFLAGDFNGWNPSDAQYELTQAGKDGFQLIETMKPGIISFKVTRGSWQAVECTSAGKPIENRSVMLAHDTTIVLDITGWQDNFKAEEKKHTASANVHILSDKFEIPQLGRQRRVWIYLPADYEASQRKYPVIYMQDGQNLFDAYTSGYGEWGVDEIMDKLPAKDRCIIVGIDHGGEHRLSEYDPYDTKYGKGEGSGYADFLVKTLKPYIDEHYRTKKDPPNTTVAGSSMGGLISMYAILKYPDVFGNAGVFSPSFWLPPAIYDYAKQQPLRMYTRIYFACGDSESDSMVADMQKMAGLVRAKGVSEQNSPELIVKGAQHNEKQWNRDFPAFYKWLNAKSGSR